MPPPGEIVGFAHDSIGLPRDRVGGPGRDLEAAVDAMRTLTETLHEWAQPAEAELVHRVADVVLAQLRANRSVMPFCRRSSWLLTVALCSAIARTTGLLNWAGSS